MISSKKELKFYIAADMMMNRGKFKWTFKDRIRNLFLPDSIMRYLKSMRYLQYLSENKRIAPIDFIWKLFHYQRFIRLGKKLGFSIGYKTLGYGVVIPHYGTIVVGSSNRIDNYAVLHTSTCITDNKKVIGDAAYVSTGVKITSKVSIGDNVSFGANSLVNKDFPSNSMVAGMPAKVIKSADAWYIRDGDKYQERVSAVEVLKNRMICC